MLRRLLTLLLLPLMLGGCGSTANLENRAYALLLGADVTGEGGVALSVIVPQVASASGQDSKAGDASPCLAFSARGGSFAEALENLEWVVPRKLSLSHILLLALSEEAARSDRCPELIDRIMQTRSLYAEARVAVCAGSAEDYVKGLAPSIEPKLSSEFDAALARNAAKGYSADLTLADLYYAGHSDYGDAVAARAGDIPRAGEDDSPIRADGRSPILVPDAGGAGETHGKLSWLGGAAFRDGRLALELSAGECACVGLARGTLREVTLDNRGAPAALSVTSAQRRVSWDGAGARLELTLTLTGREGLSAGDAAAMESALADALRAAIGRCQAAGVEPFGFSEAAVRRFATLDAWRKSGWREAYAAADVEVRVSIQT